MDEIYNSGNFDIIHKKIVDCSMNESKKHIDKGATKKFIVIPDQQTAGRGTSGRKWSGNIIGNIYSTICIPIEMIPKEIYLTFPILVSISIHHHLNNIKEGEFFVKWPNDILCHDGYKLCGLLVDDYKDFVLVAIGINLVGKPSPSDKAIRDGGSIPCFVGEHVDKSKIPSNVDLSIKIGDTIIENLKLSKKEIVDKWNKNATKNGKRLAELKFLEDNKLIVLADGKVIDYEEDFGFYD